MRNSRFFGAAIVCLGALGASDASAIVTSSCFVQTNLVSSPNGPPAQVRDPNLINSWGLVTLGNGNFWTANNGTSTATLFRSSGSPVLQDNSPVVISVPGAPTGIVQNATPGLLIQSEDRAAPSN